MVTQLYLHTAAFTLLHQLISNEVSVGGKKTLPQTIGEIVAKYEKGRSLKSSCIKINNITADK